MPNRRASRTLSLLVACTAVFLLVSPVCAFELRLEQTSPGGANPPGGVGSLVSFDLIIRHEASEPYVPSLSVGLSFDPTVIQYRPDLSDAADYYPLYAPTLHCGGCPSGVWSDPVWDPPALSPSPPPERQQIDIAFEDLYGSGYFALDWPVEEEWLASIVFEQVGATSWLEGFRFDLDHDGSQFIVQELWRAPQDGLDQVSTSLILSPEPSTLLMLSFGLLMLGVAARR